MNLSIRQILGGRQAQVGRFGVKIPADLGLAASVDAMTTGATGRENFVPGLQIVCGGGQRIFSFAAPLGTASRRADRAITFSNAEGSSVALNPRRINAIP